MREGRDRREKRKRVKDREKEKLDESRRPEPQA